MGGGHAFGSEWRYPVGFEHNGVTISCEACRCVAGDEQGAFEVMVPVSAGGFAGTARIRCVVSGGDHQVELLAWADAARQAVEPPADVLERLSAVLSFVAEQQICGNHHVCPTEVVRIVKEHSG
jgi:hypothetical protein